MNTLENPYRGVNAHLNSKLQLPDRWAEFHSSFIAGMRRIMVSQLLPRGYRVTSESSLQIRFDSTYSSLTRRSPDLGIFDTKERNMGSPLQTKLAHAEVLELEERFSEDESEAEYRALAIYDDTDKLVVWAELLSPTNKLPHEGNRKYILKRRQIFETDVTFVEIDFLHQQAATFRTIADYSQFEDGAFAYRGVVVPYSSTQPRRQMYHYPSGVDQPLHTCEAPIISGDNIAFDLDAFYQDTFEANGYGAFIDYTVPPVNFDSYRDDDKRLILGVMRRVAQQQTP